MKNTKAMIYPSNIGVYVSGYNNEEFEKIMNDKCICWTSINFDQR